ncbi:MAG: hypothetical protein F4Y01_09380 [Gammaproteobacteria bacterium]|nr:hypothetical protein [Gammaproteobacteria bacterium]
MNWKPWRKVAAEGVDAAVESAEDTEPTPSRRWPWQRFEYVYATPKGVLASLGKSLWRAAVAGAAPPPGGGGGIGGGWRY